MLRLRKRNLITQKKKSFFLREISNAFVVTQRTKNISDKFKKGYKMLLCRLGFF